ncbi:putative aldo/keto reductase-like oxidoreductase [Ereboglobus sp. PH5-5]|uniref:aldo/keto reductase n=1 Tax=unclassified Ereboglobus TaxID=2626932 RepID=UPI002404F9D2|nr:MULTISPECIES: aldo/keto reductase [unclassified Ereboglobus]MDF9826731.1 putative aldo/keto reductase-like oxidoreductase [Ereboglobus sp. PH5-10]MDF9833369.1 putative aldo/keto reductase-like oxidoreductase [Ereboglobus sp. PH5-5]
MKKNINRRRFLSHAATGGAGLILSSALRAQPSAGEKTVAPQPPKFEVRPLGKTGIKLPVLSMGVMRADNPNLVRAALRNGVVHFDTAHSYQRGNNETMLGKVLKGVPRDQFVIATKVGVRREIFNDNAPDIFMEKFNTSMERLGLEYVDILYLHGVNSGKAVLHEPIHNVMRTLKKQGRIKHCGVSTHDKEPEVIDAVIKGKFYEVVLTAYNFKKQQSLDIKSAIARAAAAGIGIVAMKTMAGAKDINVSAALKWALRDKNVTTAIPGYTNFDELDVCLESAASLAYTPEEKAFIDGGKKVASLYCTQCHGCDGQCPQNLPIPDLMRAYMYAHGYRQPGLAKETITELGLPDNPCGDCETCTVNCRSGFLVAEKIRDISRIRNVPDEFLV